MKKLIVALFLFLLPLSASATEFTLENFASCDAKTMISVINDWANINDEENFNTYLDTRLGTDADLITRFIVTTTFYNRQVAASQKEFTRLFLIELSNLLEFEEGEFYSRSYTKAEIKRFIKKLPNAEEIAACDVLYKGYIDYINR